MTFTPNIPATGQSLGQTKNLISGNFTNYFNTISQDHVPPNGSGGYAQGKHVASRYVVQGSDPTTIANEIAVYSKAISGIPTLFQRQQNNGTVATLISIIASSVFPIPNGGANQTQYALSLGGISIRFGFAAACANNSTINFSPNFTSACYYVNLTPAFSGSASNLTLGIAETPTSASFSVKLTGVATTDLYYLAIGN